MPIRWPFAVPPRNAGPRRACALFVALGVWVGGLAAYPSFLSFPAWAEEPPSEAPTAEPLPDALQGLWLGTVGTEREKVEVGLDFRRDAQGKYQLRLTQTISNYFDVEAGEVRREGDQLVVDAVALSVRLVDGRLVGFYPGPNSPAEFRRATALPKAEAIPNVPAGPPPVWQTRLNGQIFASPVVFDGKVYVGTTGGVFNALDATTG